MSIAYPKVYEDYKPAAFAGYVLIIFCFIGLFVWAMLAEIDGGVSAPASVSVQSRRQVVQHLEGGILKEIMVREGDIVEEGQVLYRLDDTQTSANLEVVRNQLYQAMAQESRLLSEREGKRSIEFPTELAEKLDDPRVAKILKDETSLFEQRIQSIESQLAILKSRQITLRDEIDGLKRERESAVTQLFYINDELQGVRDLAEKGLVAKSRVNTLEREKARLEGVIGRNEVDESKASNNINEADLQINQIMQKYFEDSSSTLQDTRSKIADLREKIRVSEDSLSRINVVAPRSGAVQNVKANTIGQIIRPGEAFLEIVPAKDQFVLEAQVQPNDVNVINIGSQVEIRFPAFHTRSTPVMFGRLKSLSHDQLFNDATKQPYFLAQISIDDADIPQEIKGKLRAGMPGEVMFSTGSRTVMEYFMHPLKEAFRHAWRET